jgi:hypothetical protein
VRHLLGEHPGELRILGVEIHKTGQQDLEALSYGDARIFEKAQRIVNHRVHLPVVSFEQRREDRLLVGEVLVERAD